MVQRVQSVLVDDLDGYSPAEETVHFALDGVNYEIDLSRPNADKLRETVRPWQEHGRRLPRAGRRPRGGDRRGNRNGSARARIDPVQSRAIRVWATENGFKISSRGKIPDAVHRAFDAAHQ
jgi:hypothetical protein